MQPNGRRVCLGSQLEAAIHREHEVVQTQKDSVSPSEPRGTLRPTLSCIIIPTVSPIHCPCVSLCGLPHFGTAWVSLPLLSKGQSVNACWLRVRLHHGALETGAGLFFILPILCPGNFFIPQPRATVVEIIKPHARFTTLSTLKQKGTEKFE